MNSTPTIQVYSLVGTDIPQHFTTRCDFSTKEEAEAFLASFPKKLKGRIYHGTDMNEARYFGVEFLGDFRSKKNNTINETGIARFRALVATNLFTFNPDERCRNAYRTVEAALAAIANSESEAQ
jgi:hypothetical protein